MQAQTIKLPIVDILSPRPNFLPLVIPEDLADRLKTFHGDGSVWWIGQILRYLMTFNKQMETDMQSAAEKLQFQTPIVG